MATILMTGRFPAGVARIDEVTPSSSVAVSWRGYAALSQLKGDHLELSFSTAELRDICERRNEAKARLGDDAALELAQILADIEAFDDFAQFAAVFASRITDRGNSDKCFLMNARYLIILRAGHPRNLGSAAAPTDWAKTTRLMITAIEKVDA